MSTGLWRLGGRRRVATAAAVALLLALAVVGGVAYSLARGLAERSADKHLRLVGDLYDSLIHEWLEDERETLAAWSNAATFRGLVLAAAGSASDPGAVATLRRMLQDRLRESRYLSLTICMQNCARSLLAVGAADGRPVDAAPAQRLAVRASLGDLGSDLAVEAVLDPRHELARLVRRPVDEIDEVRVTLVLRQGDQLVPVAVSTQPATGLPLRLLQGAGSSMHAEGDIASRAVDPAGVELLSRVRTIAGTPWLLVTSMPVERALAETNHLFLITAALLVPLLALGGWWGLTMRRQVLARHALLSERAEAERRVAELSDRVVVAQEMERRRIVGHLHDETGASLATLQINLKALTRRLDLSEEDAALLRESSELVLHTVAGLRSFVAGLRPAELEYGGLREAITAEAARVKRRFGLEVQIELDGYRSVVSPQAETTLFRVIQEALLNCVKHAGARSARVRLATEADGSLQAEVIDDGAGFDTAAVRVRHGGHGQGLLIMRERAASISGSVQIESAPGRGTRVRLSIPRAGL